MSESQEQKMLKCARKFVLAKRERLIANGPQPEIAVVWRAPDSWAILIDGFDVLNRDGKLEYEPMPSSRTDDFFARTRFPLEEAWERAEALIEKEGYKTVY